MATPLVAKTSLDETQASDDDEIRTLYGQDPSTFEDENDFNTPPPPPQVDTELPQEDDPLLPSTDFIPADHRLSTRFVTFVFFCLGMATLLPWNFFISVNSFWDYKFRDVNDTDDDYAVSNHSDVPPEHQTELQKEFTSYLAIASNVPNAMFVILNAIYGQKFPLRLRLLGSLGFIVLLFIVVTVFSRVNSDSWQHDFMIAILVMVVLINVGTAIFQGGLFGVAGKFPPAYMSAVMTGQAMGGIFPAIVNIVVVSVNIHEKYVGFFCFLVASAFLLACLALFIMVNTNPLYRYYAESQATPQAPTRDYEGMQNQPALEGEERSSVFLIFSKPLMYHGSVFLIFCITLSVFPAITVLVQSQYSGTTWGQVYFTPVTCFLLFNVGDFVGRWLANYFQTPSKSTRGQRIVLILSIVRTVFIPLFLFCNASPTKRELPVLFHSDMVYILLMSALALSNGYLGNICMIHGPKVWEDSQNQEATAMMLVAFLVLGTSIGSVFSNVLVKCV